MGRKAAPRLAFTPIGPSWYLYVIVKSKADRERVLVTGEAAVHLIAISMRYGGSGVDSRRLWADAVRTHEGNRSALLRLRHGLGGWLGVPVARSCVPGRSSRVVVGRRRSPQRARVPGRRKPEPAPLRRRPRLVFGRAAVRGPRWVAVIRRRQGVFTGG